jgi:UDP-3-O-[3-hydroxymyristoyl] glucosamine N-acyltransferase
MRFHELLLSLGVDPQAAPCDLARDPVLHAGAALDEAEEGTLSFLDRDAALADALSGTGASAVLLPRDEDLQAAAARRGIAWAAVDHPRLAFARALALLHPPRRPAAGIAPSAVVAESVQLGRNVSIGAHVVVGEGCRIGDGCTLHPGVVLYPEVSLADGCEIHANAVLHEGCRLGDGCVIHAGAVVGSEGFGFVPSEEGWVKMPQTGRVVLEAGVEVGCGSTIDRPAVGETRIGAGTKIDNLVHVGHGVRTGRGCALAAQVGIAGGARLGDGVILAGQVGVANRARIGDRAIASSKSGIHGEVAAGEVVSGYPAIPNRLWLRCSAAFSKLPEMARTLRRLQR